MTTWFARTVGAPSLKAGGVDHAHGGGGVIPSSRNWPYFCFWQELLRASQPAMFRRGSGAERGAVGGEGREENEKKSKKSSPGDSVGTKDELLVSGVGATGRLRSGDKVPSCPLLYMYGADKRVRFHGDRWLHNVRNNGPGSEVVEVKGAGHWFPVTHASLVNEVLIRWLEDTANLPNIRQLKSAL